MDQKNYFISAFGTFGNPNGFRQSFFFLDNSHSKIARNLATFDLNTVAIKILPKSKVYAIRKEFINNSNIFSYAIYSFAKEQNSERGGTFIGSSIIYKEKIGNENITVSVLEDFHQNLLKNNVENDTITVNHSDKFSVSKPKDFDKISINLKDVISNLNSFHTNKNLFVFCETSPEKLQIFFKKSIDLLNVYDTIYFTRSEEVATFVAQKGIFKFIQQVGDKKEFDQEIDKLEIERKQKITDAIEKFEKHKLQLEEEKNREIENRKKQIEQNQQKQSENQKKIEESKSDLSKLENLYKTFAGHISILMSALHSGKTLDEVNNFYKQFEKEFNDEKRKLNSSTQISSFSNSRSPAQVSPYSNPYEKSHQSDSEDDEKKSSMKVVAIVSLVLNILLIGGLAYLLYSIYTDNEKKIANTENFASSNENINSLEKDSVVVERQLNPIPNDIAKNNIDKIKNELTDNSTEVNDVVKIIFDKNKPIKNVYQFQKQEYAHYLIKQNPDAFDSNNVLMRKGLLTKIPSFSETSVKKDSLNNSVSK